MNAKKTTVRSRKGSRPLREIREALAAVRGGDGLAPSDPEYKYVPVRR